MVLILVITLPLAFSVKDSPSRLIAWAYLWLPVLFPYFSCSTLCESVYDSMRVYDEAEENGHIYYSRDNVSLERNNPEWVDRDRWATVVASYKKMTILISFERQDIKDLPCGSLASNHSPFSKYNSQYHKKHDWHKYTIFTYIFLPWTNVINHLTLFYGSLTSQIVVKTFYFCLHLLATTFFIL